MRPSRSMVSVTGRVPMTGRPPMLVTVHDVSRIFGSGMTGSVGFGAGALARLTTMAMPLGVVRSTGAGAALRKRGCPLARISATRPRGPAVAADVLRRFIEKAMGGEARSVIWLEADAI